MFEQEAEDYVNEEYDFCYYPEDNLSTRVNAKRDWQKGAEFGYNKANEWHYPSKGEYPKDDTDVLVAYYTRFNSDTKQPLGELQCKIAGYLGKKWISTDTGCGNKDYWLNKPDMVYAWKEIKLPKEVF